MLGLATRLQPLVPLRDLTKRVTVSPTRVSRIESGGIDLTSDEIGQLLDAIGTDEAKAFRESLDQAWDALPCPPFDHPGPPFDHPDRDSLWAANRALGKLRTLRADPELKNVFVRYIEAYETELLTVASDLLSIDHRWRS